MTLPRAAAPLALAGLCFAAPVGAAPPEPDPAAAEAPEGYRIEVFADGLDYPASAEPDGAGGLFVALSGKAPGDCSAEPALLHSGHGGHGPGGSAGPRRPMDVRFTADGSAMYVAEFGLMPVDKHGPHAKPNTGVIWKIVPAG